MDSLAWDDQDDLDMDVGLPGMQPHEYMLARLRTVATRLDRAYGGQPATVLAGWAATKRLPGCQMAAYPGQD